jgi:hypothetical protein
MKYKVTFPTTAGQYAGEHQFPTKRARREFLQRAANRGIDVSTAVLT